MASYGAEYQHESTSFSLALLLATERLKVIAAVHPGLWHPGVLAKLGATADHLSGGRFAVNVVSGWFKGEFTALGEPWLEHDERYRRSEEFIRALRGDLDRGPRRARRRLLPDPRLLPEAQAAQHRRAPAPGDLPGRQLHRRPRHGRPGLRLVLQQRQGLRRASPSRSTTSAPAAAAQPAAGVAVRPQRLPHRPGHRGRGARRAARDRREGRHRGGARASAPRSSRPASRPRDGKGMWQDSSFEDLVQYNDGFRTGLIGTPGADRRAHRGVQAARRGSAPARLPALPGGGRVLRQARVLPLVRETGGPAARHRNRAPGAPSRPPDPAHRDAVTS